MRGVGLDATGFYWVTGLFCAIVFAVVMVVLARLSAGRRAQD
jgi:tetrahydromethanopterin S-methyltransferase subunit F